MSAVESPVERSARNISDEEDEAEETDESLHLPDDAGNLWEDVDGENDSDDNVDGDDISQWKRVTTPVEKITVNGAKTAQWKTGMKELEQIKNAVK